MLKTTLNFLMTHQTHHVYIVYVVVIKPTATIVSIGSISLNMTERVTVNGLHVSGGEKFDLCTYWV